MREEPPLVVDLDGTLIRTDLLIESALVFLRDRPHRSWQLAQWLLRGKAALKAELASVSMARFDPAALPYNESVLALVRQARDAGRRSVLATASDSRLAERVAAHTGLFDDVLGSDGVRNLSARHKRDALVAQYGPGGFDYVGNSRDDVVVWQAAREAIVVEPERGVEKAARRLGNVSTVMRSPRVGLGVWFEALRIHQWLKNLLVFVPLLAAHRHDEFAPLGAAALAFVAFGLCASSVYLLNDLLDLPDDRQHARKKNRPFASGRLAAQGGLLACPLLLIAAFAIAIAWLPPAFSVGLSVYYALTLAYSLVLKRRVVIDVLVLAVLYTLRIIVGALAIGVALSFWLLAFSMFMFLSLALVKRYAELEQLRARAGGDKASGRGYFAADLPIIAALGAAAGYMAVMVLALYIDDERTTQLYRHPEFIWMACPLLLGWISRVWVLAHRGQMNEDPVVFALRDRASAVIVGAMTLVFWAAA